MKFYIIVATMATVLSTASGCLDEDVSLPRNCKDIRDQGFSHRRHYVVYHTVDNITEDARMIFCDENNGIEFDHKPVGNPEKTVAKNCKELQDQGMIQDGINIIYPFADHPETPVLVLCNQTHQGGGWTVINRRDENFALPTDFLRTFDEYASGFGDVNYDFYIGNEVIHALTDSSINELWVDIEDIYGVIGHAHYQVFHVGARQPDNNQEPPYMMDSAFYQGTIGEALGYHNGMGFTAVDEDHDVNDFGNCAKTYKGGWWFKNCALANLNGLYGSSMFRWFSSSEGDPDFILSKAQMMVRPLEM